MPTPKQHQHDEPEKNSLAHFLHISNPSPTPKDFVNKIRNGLPFKIVGEFSKELGISQHELSKSIGVNERTLARRKEKNKLHQEESDRLYRLIRVYLFAIKVLKDKKTTIEWLNTPKTALGGEIPFTLLDTEVGVREVENLLGRIEYSVYS